VGGGGVHFEVERDATRRLADVADGVEGAYEVAREQARASAWGVRGIPGRWGGRGRPRIAGPVPADADDELGDDVGGHGENLMSVRTAVAGHRRAVAAADAGGEEGRWRKR